MFSSDAEYAAKECEKLVGYEIVGVCRDPENGSYGLIISKEEPEPSQKLCWIDMDPEGNGPGWIQVEDA